MLSPPSSFSLHSYCSFFAYINVSQTDPDMMALKIRVICFFQTVVTSYNHHALTTQNPMIDILMALRA
jgi:hypothetical protein